MTTHHPLPHPQTKPSDDLRQRNARALKLVGEWFADESGYDLEVFPDLMAELEADRLSYRRRFKE